jgi:hypothetical protein
MIQINLVARIDDDKNSFLDLVYVAYMLKKDGITDFKILFIGGVHKQSIYQNIVHLADLLDVESHIGFTMKAIPLAQLPEDTKQGYFLNYTVGAFVGYSAIESIDLGLRAIFLNGDKELVGDMPKTAGMCPDLDSLITLIATLVQDKSAIDAKIDESNAQLKKSYFLTTADRSNLLSLLLPGNQPL